MSIDMAAKAGAGRGLSRSRLGGRQQACVQLMVCAHFSPSPASLNSLSGTLMRRDFFMSCECHMCLHQHGCDHNTLATSMFIATRNM
jgi:hypothetical protein